MKLIVGLGNPGSTYERTRHNVGWRVLDALPVDFSFEKKFNAEIARAGDVLYCKPQTFMNNSGQAVQAVMDFYKIDVADVMLVYDDKDLPFGTIRVRSTGSSGGHNGVQSVIDHLGTSEIARVRIGVAADHPIEDTANFVLGRFTTEEESKLPKIIQAAIEGIEDTTHRDIETRV